MRVNTIRLRVMLGVLGMILPWIVVLLQLFNGVENFVWPSSISATYYTNASTVFMIILGSAAILLMCYKGYEWYDDLTLSLAGVAALGICLFPTWDKAQLVGTFMLDHNTSSTIHNIFAIIFFGLLSYNSIFLFTKGDKNPTNKKKIRNIIYIVSGIGMLASFLIFLIPDACFQLDGTNIKIWLLETIALFFFGLSFLTKADVFPFLFCDTPYKD